MVDMAWVPDISFLIGLSNVRPGKLCRGDATKPPSMNTDTKLHELFLPLEPSRKLAWQLGKCTD